MSTTHPPERGLVALLKGLTLGASAPDIMAAFEELKEVYEAQERAAPAEYAVEQDEDVKQACKEASLLFVARVLAAAKKREQDGSEAQPSNFGLSITRIVTGAGINLLDFFREVTVVVSKLSAYFESRGSSSQQFSQHAQLKENSEVLVVMMLLAKKYKDNFNTFLHQLDFYKQVVLRLGWSAFLMLRVKLLSAFPDVVSCVELLPCIFAILASHAPRLPDCLTHITRENRDKMLLKSMAEMCKADYDRVKARMPSVEALLTQVLTSAVPEWRSAVAEAKAKALLEGSGAIVGGVDLVAAPVFEGLVTDTERMNRAVAALELEYELHFSRGGSELDEREFLSTDFTKFKSPRFSPAHMRNASMPLRSGGLLGPGSHTTLPALPGPQKMHLMMGLPPGLHSPLPMMHLNAGPGGVPGTPISEAMGSSAWLRSVTSNLAAEPSATLQRFIAALPISNSNNTAGPAPVQQLMKRVRDLVASVIPDETAPSLLGPFPLMTTSLGSERRTEAVKLYYQCLEVILSNEERANGLPAALALLGSAKFQRGLIACCIEVVAACYRMASCTFPKVLDALRIKAFDMANIIGTFVKSIPSLPRDLKRHLFLIEEKILELLAWEPGSSLYHLIVNVHAENEAAAAATTAALQDAAATAACSAASGDDSQHDGAGSRAGPSSSSGGAGAAAAAEGGVDGGAEQPGASSSHNTEQSGGAAPMEAEGGAAGAATSAPPSAAPVEPAPPAAAVATTAGPLVPHAPPPSPKRSQTVAFSGMMSPAKKARGTDGGAHSTMAYIESLPLSVGFPPAAGTAQGQAGLLFEFLRKVLKLLSFRLALLCENFDFSPLERPEVNSKVYETIEHALYKQTHLFYNRHIDQVMLSALYGYCKVHKLSQVSFREIIAQYRKQPQSQQSVFRSVVIDQVIPTLQIQTRADIIAFYNAVFVPAMKSFLLKCESNGSGASGPGLIGDSKHAAAGNSGNAIGAAAGAPPALGVGATSAMPPGLPPLPPRASQSPRGTKLPMLGGIAPAPRLLGRSASGNTRGNGGERELSGMPLLGPMGPAGSSTGGGAQSPSKGGEGSGHPAPTASMAGSRSVNGGRGGGGRGGGGRGAAVREIPEGLAALLQALDSQQGADKNGEEGETEAEEAGEEQAQARVTRSGRGARDRSAGRDARRSRHADDVDDGSMDAELSQQAMVTGRRQRTPNRRYGAE